MSANYNRLRTLTVLALFLFTLLPVHLSPAAALGVSPQTTEETGDVFTFGQLGYVERIMLSPYDTLQIPFGLPSNWALVPGAQITLRFNYATNRSGLSADNALIGGTLRVSFNGIILRTILLDKTGEIIETIPIAAEALKPTSIDGRYRISFLFDSRFDCDNTAANSSIVISASSSIDLKHELVPLQPDLTIFPRPIYQADSIIPSVATLVIPDNPSEAELRAALAVSAGLGALTNGRLQYSLIPAAQISEAQKTGTSFILIGMPQNLLLLQDISVPYPLRGGEWSVTGIQPEDGLVQMAVSPWAQDKLVVIVSGNSEAGLIKAAQAVSTGNLVAAGRPDVSVISAVNPLSMNDSVPEDQTLFSLGYENKPLGGFEGTYASYFFPASSEQVLSTEGYIDLVTSHTNLLDFERSGITLYLNRTFIGSIKFTGEVDQVTTTRLKLLPGIIRRGSNLLEIYSDLVPIYNCYSPDLSSNVIVISGLTNIHLPLTGQKMEFNTLLRLNDFPAMFISDRSLSDLALVVAKNDPIGWETASKIAFDIGASAAIPIANLQAAFGDSVSQSIREKSNLILVGLASTLPILADFNDKLPAPFAPGSDEALQPALLVNYRLLPGVTVGYLQLMQSPWNAGNVILVVSGNATPGLPIAGEKLIRSEFNSQLNGNFSVIYQDQVLTTDTRMGVSKEPLIAGLPAEVLVTPSPQPAAQPAPDVSTGMVEIETRPAWMVPAMITLSVATLLVLLLLVGKAVMSKRVHTKKQPGKNPGSD